MSYSENRYSLMSCLKILLLWDTTAIHERNADFWWRWSWPFSSQDLMLKIDCNSHRVLGYNNNSNATYQRILKLWSVIMIINSIVQWIPWRMEILIPAVDVLALDPLLVAVNLLAETCVWPQILTLAILNFIWPILHELFGTYSTCTR